MDAATDATPPAPPQPTTAGADGWHLDHSYARLPQILHVPWHTDPVAAPRLIVFNRPLAATLGLDAAALDTPAGALVFAGNSTPPGGWPLAQAYAGHQFGHFTGLGDGRALLLGEQLAPDGRRFDIQLKGSGPTPFSRGGDGRAALGPMLREYLISEAMHALGIPSTRSLAVAATGEEVIRQDGPLPGAVLTRVAASHIRVGTFEWLAAHRDHDALAALVTHTLERHFPDRADSENPALALLEAVVNGQAELIARWLHTGFVHGVMNTDNMALSGETIDYGPCAFLDAHDPATVFSSIDRNGRYAYGQQADIAQWNLARLAESLLPRIDPVEETAIELASAAVRGFAEIHHRRWLDGMRAKLGLFGAEETDAALVRDLFDWMTRNRADYTNTFRLLSREESRDEPPFAAPGFADWHRRWRDRLASQAQPWTAALGRMRAHNPVVIPRNHLVEEALTAATDGDPQPFHRLLEILAMPYDHEAPIPARFLAPAPADAPPYRTYCGT